MEPDVTGMAPWLIVQGTAPEAAAASRDRVGALRNAGYAVDHDAVIAPHAVVGADQFAIGPRSYLADYTHIRDDVEIGADCSVNAFTEIRGRVRIGDGVRIGASTSILGFNHEMDRVDVPIHRQGITMRGISIGDDVWLGAHVVVLDGVRIGSHAVVGAGAVVTRDVPEYAVAVGNPARVVRDRRDPRAEQDHPADGLETPRDLDKNAPRMVQNDPANEVAAAARDVGSRARREVPGILERAFDGERYRDAPDSPPTPRAHCDAIELADLIGQLPPQLTRERHLDLLRADLAAIPTKGPTPLTWPTGDAAYHVLCVGHALDLLGEPPGDEFPAWTALPGPVVARALGELPWDDHAWQAGAEVDTLAAAWTWAGEHRRGRRRDALIGWLMLNRDPISGLWGSETSEDGWRQAVNGTYRLVRGTFAQWGVAAGEGEPLIDTVLGHANSGILGPDRVTACDALDVTHLLWWARREGGADHRESEVAAVARDVLDLAGQVWHDGEGAPFAPGVTEQHLVSGADPALASLQGTEMWLAVAWYAADLLGVADELGYRPRGIHRPEPRPD